jgi:hypothetical protein
MTNEKDYTIYTHKIVWSGSEGDQSCSSQVCKNEQLSYDYNHSVIVLRCRRCCYALICRGENCPYAAICLHWFIHARTSTQNSTKTWRKHGWGKSCLSGTHRVSPCIFRYTSSKYLPCLLSFSALFFPYLCCKNQQPSITLGSVQSVHSGHQLPLHFVRLLWQHHHTVCLCLSILLWSSACIAQLRLDRPHSLLALYHSICIHADIYKQTRCVVMNREKIERTRQQQTEFAIRSSKHMNHSRSSDAYVMIISRTICCLVSARRRTSDVRYPYAQIHTHIHICMSICTHNQAYSHTCASDIPGDTCRHARRQISDVICRGLW